MTTMLEKMAYEIYARSDTSVDWAMDDAMETARAALQAIREVPEEIFRVAIYDEYDWAGRNFTAMIDAILEEKPE